jgi:hypothetical protein
MRFGRSRNWDVAQAATRVRFFELSLKERRDPRFNPLRRAAIEVTRRGSVGIANRGSGAIRDFERGSFERAHGMGAISACA